MGMGKKMSRATLSLLLLLATFSAAAQTQWHDPMAGTEAMVNGRAWNSETGKNYQRLPDRLRGKMSKAVWNNSRQAAGLSVTFITTSPNIVVRYVVGGNPGLANMPMANYSGCDLYVTDCDGRQTWLGGRMRWRWRRDTVTYTYGPIDQRAIGGQGLYYTLYLPPYNSVKALQIGTDGGKTFSFVSESHERPIVCYGSSIIQGASPERPGNMITNMVSRELDYPIVNLGFSGAALMEPAVFEALAEIDARAFIIDPIPNSYSLKPDTVEARAYNGVRLLRRASGAPVLLVEGFLPTDSLYIPKVYKEYKDANSALRRAYRRLVAEGVKDVHYLPAADLGIGEECLVDGIHPNDIGCRHYANAYEKAIKAMLPEDWTISRYMPVRQRRDHPYEWMVRHNEVLALNHSRDPELLLIGNSITHFWGGEPRYEVNNGGAAWDETFKGKRVVNMGFGWDRIENVWWRVLHGELEGCRPKDIVLLIGINNLNVGDTPEDVANGIVQLSRLIHERQPQARLYVCKVLPSREQFQRVAKTNELLDQLFAQQGSSMPSNVRLIDIGSGLRSADGTGIDPAMFRPDGLHPNEEGYRQMGRALTRNFKSR